MSLSISMTYKNQSSVSDLGLEFQCAVEMPLATSRALYRDCPAGTCLRKLVVRHLDGGTNDAMETIQSSQFVQPSQPKKSPLLAWLLCSRLQRQDLAGILLAKENRGRPHYTTPCCIAHPTQPAAVRMPRDREAQPPVVACRRSRLVSESCSHEETPGETPPPRPHAILLAQHKHHMRELSTAAATYGMHVAPVCALCPWQSMPVAHAYSVDPANSSSCQKKKMAPGQPPAAHMKQHGRP